MWISEGAGDRPAQAQMKEAGDASQRKRGGFSMLVSRLAVVAGFVLVAPTGYAHDAGPNNPDVRRELLSRTPLPDFPGRIVTALTVELAPGAVVGPHRHGGFVYVYLLQGSIRSHMEGEEPAEYMAGQSWIEPANALHTRTENSSTTEPAKFLAVVYSERDAVITQPEGKIH